MPDPKSQVEKITIAVIYKFMDDMDAEWGTGYERIVADCDKLGHPVPVWEEIGERQSGSPSDRTPRR